MGFSALLYRLTGCVVTGELMGDAVEKIAEGYEAHQCLELVVVEVIGSVGQAAALRVVTSP
jgi:hypothetical protein